MHSVDIKKHEPAFAKFSQQVAIPFYTHTAQELNSVADHLDASEAALAATGAQNVSEASALIGSGNHQLIMTKTKGCDHEGKHFTMALALDWEQERQGMIYIAHIAPAHQG